MLRLGFGDNIYCRQFLFIFGTLQSWKGKDCEQAERKKGASAVWARQDQQQCLAEGNTHSSCRSAELFNISIPDTGQGA